MKINSLTENVGQKNGQRQHDTNVIKKQHSDDTTDPLLLFPLFNDIGSLQLHWLWPPFHYYSYSRTNH